MGWLGVSGEGNPDDKEPTGQPKMIGTEYRPSPKIKIKMNGQEQVMPVPRRPGQANIKPTNRGFARLVARRQVNNQASGFHPNTQPARPQIMGEGLPQ
jgi:hypothetical protein